MSNGSKGPAGVNPTNPLSTREPIYADIDHSTGKKGPSGRSPTNPLNTGDLIYSEVNTKGGLSKEPIYAKVNKNRAPKSPPVLPPKPSTPAPPPKPTKNPLTSQLKEVGKQSISKFAFSDPQDLGFSNHSKGKKSKSSHPSHGYGPKVDDGSSSVPKYGNDMGSMTSSALPIIKQEQRPSDNKKIHKKFIDKFRPGKSGCLLNISSPSLLETSNLFAGDRALYGSSNLKPFAAEVEKFQRENGLLPIRRGASPVRRLNLIRPPSLPKK